MIDAPVSGGVAGAQGATLTFMVGGCRTPSSASRPILEKMGKTIVHAGGAGNGQAAKICNNMILGVSMIVVSEAFLLAEKLGLDAQKLFDIASKSSGQCWSMTSYCPVPGPVPSSPANRDYKAGFTAAMMLKDLKLAQAAARATRRHHAARRRRRRGLRAVCRERRRRNEIVSGIDPISARMPDSLSSDEIVNCATVRITHFALRASMNDGYDESDRAQSTIHRRE